MKTPQSKTRTLRAAASAVAIGVTAATALHAQNTLVTGKAIHLPAIGQTQNVGSLPMNLMKTPNGKWAISTDMGFRQSLWCINTATGAGVSHIDFNTATASDPHNGLYYGLAMKGHLDGTTTVYAAQGANATIAVVNVAADGTLTQTGEIAMKNKPGDFASGLSIDDRGYLYVAVNESNGAGGASDLVTPGALAIIDTKTGLEVGRYSFAIPAGPIAPTNYPLAVAAFHDGSKVFVGSERDDKVYVIDASTPSAPTLIGGINSGSHPIGLLLANRENRLYIANASSDTVTVWDAHRDRQIATVPLRPTGSTPFAGVTPTNLTVSPDEKTVYATLGDLNSVAVIDAASNTLTGYIPAGWYPTGVVATNSKLLVSNAKGHQTRYPNPSYQQWSFDGAYGLNMIEGDVQTMNVPNATQLAQYTADVAKLNFIGKNDWKSNQAYAGKIKHVIYIVKENRTYDQVLGDLPQGNGDASLALFGSQITPNLHALASRFVLLDNFYDCGEASGDGWPWSTGSMANENVIKNLPYNYSGRGRNYDFEGQNNGYPTGGFPANDPDGNPLSAAFPAGLPAIKDVAEAPGGHIWDSVQAAGLSYRNFGFYYTFGVTGAIPDNYPASTGLLPPGHDLSGKSDFDYRRYDAAFPDSDAPAQVFAATNDPNALFPKATYGKHGSTSRFAEWNNEFQQMLAKDPTGDGVPALMTVRFMNDHTVGFSAGAHSPRSLVADNDYAVGQLVEAVSKSPIWKDTAIFVIEDDSQDGPDHVDSHRSICFAISPWIKQNSVDHTFYNTDSVLKTIEMLLGVKPLSQYDATAEPIHNFDRSASNAAPYTAVAEDPAIITERNPALAAMKPGSKALHYAKLAAKMDFTHPDSADPKLLNEMIWKSVHGMDSTMPAPRTSVKLAKVVAKGSVKSVKAIDRDDD